MSFKDAKIAVIAGAFSLPIQICQKLESENVNFIVIPLINQADSKDFAKYKTFPKNLEKIGAILKVLKKNKVNNVVFAGTINRPNLKGIRPDIKGIFLLYKLLKLKNRGDDNLFKAISLFLQKQKINIIPVQTIMPNLLATKGTLTKAKVPKEILKNVDSYINIAKSIGKLDIGQSIIVSENIIVAVEAKEGTDNMIKRSKSLITKKDYAVLVKVSKPNQLQEVDMPTIGIKTLNNCIESGIKGIIIEAEKTLLLDKEETLGLANENGVFILSV